MITKNTKLGIRQQCCLLQINRSLLYYNRRTVVDYTCLANALADIYLQYPVYGYRRLTACLKRQGHDINGKHVLRLMRPDGFMGNLPKT